MNKTVKKVFMLIGVLVLIFLIWQLMFRDGGIVKTIYNTTVTGINGQWHKVAGDNSNLLPTWDETETDTGSKVKGFDVDTE